MDIKPCRDIIRGTSHLLLFQSQLIVYRKISCLFTKSQLLLFTCKIDLSANSNCTASPPALLLSNALDFCMPV